MEPKIQHTPYLSEEEFRKIMKMKPTVSVDLLIKDTQGRFLLGRRNTEPYKNWWQVVGGMIYYNEKIGDTIRRIALRETGLTVFNPIFSDVYDIIDDVDPRGHVVCLAYVITDYSGELSVNADNTELEFFDIDELPTSIVSVQLNEIKDASKGGKNGT